tara:strand:- start:347 stop:1777 length:1431 start_codon:yes stop_codon:yes gene_type:complete
MKNETDLRRWKEILNWQRIPNFGNCHEIDDFNEFSRNYFLTADLEKTVENILLSLEDGAREQLNRILIGRPGCGKTSFIHYLRKQSNAGHKVLSKFHFHIYDINRANLPDYKDSLATEMLAAWTSYLSKCGKSDIATRVNQQKKSDREKCNIVESYYIANKADFDKIFVFILDETDTLDEAIVKEISRELISIVPTKEIKKWLMIRQSTLKTYSSETHDVFESFFPNQTNFLGADLYDIIGFRVEKTSRGTPQEGIAPAKNPFSKKMCINILKEVFGGNIRAALGSLESILKYTSVSNIEKYVSEEFIQNYVEKSAFPALLRLSHIPNIFSERFFISQYPISIDILIMSRHGKNLARIKRLLNEISTERARQVNVLGKKDNAREIIIPQDEFETAVEELTVAGLISQPNKREIRITQMGSFIARNLYTESYLGACLSQNEMDGFNIGGNRLDRMVGNIDHQSFMLHDYIVDTGNQI